MGMTIWSAVLDEAPVSVDNPADLERARAHARRLGAPA
jgi:3-deoxy-manno-octulosonate cytidylyltransferase (CMP-KDO synthetase)